MTGKSLVILLVDNGLPFIESFKCQIIAKAVFLGLGAAISIYHRQAASYRPTRR